MTNELPSDVRRVIYTLFGVALLCAVIAALYTNLYFFAGGLGQTLPDISPTASSLAHAFQVTAAMLVMWALGLSALATPSVAVSLRGAMSRATHHPHVAHRTALAALGLALLYVAARFGFNEETRHATLQGYTAGVAWLPFQYRALVPWGVRVLQETVPALRSLDVTLLYATFEAAAAFGVYMATAYLMQVFGVRAPRVVALAVFVPLALNLATPWRHNNIYFPYDTPSVALFTLGLALLLDSRMRAFLAVFVLATFNRETTSGLTQEPCGSTGCGAARPCSPTADPA